MKACEFCGILIYRQIITWNIATLTSWFLKRSPGDKRVVEKEQEKIEHYSDLERKLKKIWKCSHIEIVLIIVGALGIVSKSLEGWMKKISLKSSTAQLQKATLFGTARILRKILET